MVLEVHKRWVSRVGVERLSVGIVLVGGGCGVVWWVGGIECWWRWVVIVRRGIGGRSSAHRDRGGYCVVVVAAVGFVVVMR